MEFIKKNTTTILIVLATVILAGIAVFTALRLYQLRNQSISPSAPVSRPLAEELPESNKCTALTFSLGTSSPSPTPTSTASSSPTATPTSTPTEPPVGGTSPTPTPTASATATPTSKATTAPTSTSEATDEASLPKAGTTLPAYMGMAAGFLLLLGAVILAL